MSQSFIEFVDGNIASHFTKLGPSSFRRRGRVSCQLLALPRRRRRGYYTCTMDPLSLTASIITVAGLAAKTGLAFHDLRTACKSLPGRLDALNNEVVDIELVLRQVAPVVEKRAADPDFKDQQANIRHLIRQAQTKLEELRTIVKKLTEVAASVKIPLFRVAAWRRDQPKLLALQEDIKTVKCSLNIMLGASNS